MKKLMIPILPAETIRDKALEIHENVLRKRKGFSGWKTLKAREACGDYLMSLGGEETILNKEDAVHIKLKSEDVVEWIFENLPERRSPAGELRDELKAFLRFSGIFLLPPPPLFDVRKDSRAKLSLMEFYKKISDDEDVTLSRSISEKTARDLLRFIDKDVPGEMDINGVGKQIKAQVETALHKEEWVSREELILFARRQKELCMKKEKAPLRKRETPSR